MNITKKFLMGMLILLIVPVICFGSYMDEVITGTNSQAIKLSQYNVTGQLLQEATCTLEGANVRFRTTGALPTSSIGHLWVAANSMPIKFNSDEIYNIYFIGTTGSVWSVTCSYR